MRALLTILAAVFLLVVGCARKQASTTSPQPEKPDNETAELGRLYEQYRAGTLDEAGQKELRDRLARLAYRQALETEAPGSVPSGEAVEFVAEIEGVETTAKAHDHGVTTQLQQVRLRVVEVIADAAGEPRAGEQLIIRPLTRQPLLVVSHSPRPPLTAPFSEDLVGRRMRFVYHAKFAADYAGRFSVYPAAPEPEHGACEFAATISDVRTHQRSLTDRKRWLITFTVSRALDAPGGEVSKGDVFYLRVHSPSISLGVSTEGPWEGEYVLRFSEPPTPGSELGDDVWISRW
jgi:hypothetical protein